MLAAGEASNGYTYGTAGKTGPVGNFFEADDSEVEDRMAERQMSWVSAAWVINASVLGMGVLAIPSCLATLGWLLGIVALVVCLLANILVAQIMLDIQEIHPQAISLADAAQIASGGSRAVKVTFRFALYAEKIACTCAFVNLMADTLGSAFYSVHWCEATWCGVIVLIFLPLSQMKNLHETFWLNIVNFSTITAVVVLTCIVLVTTLEQGDGIVTDWMPQVTSFHDSFGALSIMVFAYSGNWMYFELMSEMKEPKKFLQSFTIAGPTQLGLYLLMGGIGYSALGRSVPPSILEALHFSQTMRIISILLTVHIVCGTATNLVVLIRFFHSRVSPKDLNSNTLRANFIRTVIYLLIICGTFAVSLAVNGFGGIVTLIGALFESPINFVCPYVIYAGVMRGRTRRTGWYPWLMWTGGAVIAMLGLATMIFGVMDAVGGLRKSSGSGGFFACRCQGLWDTCACSPGRMPEGTCRQDDLHLQSYGWSIPHRLPLLRQDYNQSSSA